VRKAEREGRQDGKNETWRSYFSRISWMGPCRSSGGMMQILVMWVFFFFVSATTRTINCLRDFRQRKETHGQYLPFQFHGHPKEGGKGHKEGRGQKSKGGRWH